MKVLKRDEISARLTQRQIPPYEFVAYLDNNKLPYKDGLFSGLEVDEEYVLEFLKEKDATEEERARTEKLKQEREAEEARERAAEEARKKKALASMLITSGFNFDGYTIKKYSGYISGDDAMTVSRGSSFTDGGVRDKLLASLTQIRRNALRELKEAAYDLGCNAVIGVDFDYITLDPQTANLSGGTTYQPYVFCVTANGNAVIIEKDED